jgi:methylated-DNA-[protein]-cysteine S-methyltransferase
MHRRSALDRPTPDHDRMRDLPGNDGEPDEHDGRPFSIAVVAAPWGPIHVAATSTAVVGLSVLAPPDPFSDDVRRRTGRDRRAGPGSALLERSVAAIEAFLDGRPDALRALPVDLASSGAWDRAVLAGVRSIGWGEVTSYGRLARAIGRPGAARAVGGAVGRNPIGLAIPCHRVIAGDGSIGGYGGDWFGSRETLLGIKRELLAREGIQLPVPSLRG